MFAVTGAITVLLDGGHAGPIGANDVSPVFAVLPVILAKRANPNMDSEQVTRVYTAAIAAQEKIRHPNGRPSQGGSGSAQPRGFGVGYPGGGRGYHPYQQSNQNQGQFHGANQAQWQRGNQQYGGYARQPQPPPRATYEGCWTCGMSNHRLGDCRELKDVRGNRITAGTQEAFKHVNC